MTEIAIDIGYLLEFVERHNKQDADRLVAQAAQNVENYLQTYKPE
jgi:hypothetical protein